MTQNPQLSTTVDKDIYDQVIDLAKKETRSLSSMVNILITQAVKERNRKKKKTIEAEVLPD